MSFLCGIPFLDYCLIPFFIFLNDLDMSAFEFFAVRYICLLHTDLCQCIFDQKHAILNLCICGRNIAILIDRECCV